MIKIEKYAMILFGIRWMACLSIDGDITKIGDKYHLFYVAIRCGGGIKQAVSDRMNGGGADPMPAGMTLSQGTRKRMEKGLRGQVGIDGDTAFTKLDFVHFPWVTKSRETTNYTG